MEVTFGRLSGSSSAEASEGEFGPTWPLRFLPLRAVEPPALVGSSARIYTGGRELNVCDKLHARKCNLSQHAICSCRY